MSLKSTHEGKFWKIYYFESQNSNDYKTSNLEGSLQGILNFLDNLNKENEEVLAIIPDTGQVGSLAFGVPVTSVTGFAVIVRKKN
jgi:hypothetical protein